MDTEENKNNHQAEAETGGTAKSGFDTTESSFNQEEGDASSGSNKLKFIAFFVVAFLVGVVIKTQASNFVEIGYNDYKLDNWKSDFSLEENQNPEENQQNEAGSEGNTETPDEIDAGGSCGG